MAYLKFKGTYHHGLDAKNRMFIPSKYRDALGSNIVLCFAPEPLVGIYVYPDATWDELCEELNEKSAQGNLTEEQEWERRNLYAHAEDVNMDTQGRITISAEMCRHAGLNGEVTIIGNMKRLEIWNPETYKTAEAHIAAGGKIGTPKLNF